MRNKVTTAKGVESKDGGRGDELIKDLKLGSLTPEQSHGKEGILLRPLILE